jgi:hypothetical protein
MEITSLDIIVNHTLKECWPFRFVNDVDIGLDKLNRSTGGRASFDRTDYSKLTPEDLDDFEEGLY